MTDRMTESERALLGRVTNDVAVMASYVARASSDLRDLNRLLAERRVEPLPSPPPWPVAPQPAAAPAPPAAPSQRPATTASGPAPAPPKSEGWVGKALAVAGVAVTLVGVVLLVVLAAQAGLLSPGVRVAAGALLAAGLVASGARLQGRPGGRVGAIALAATGIAAGYVDVVAVTAVYAWVPAAVGLLLSAAVAGAGLTLSRRWHSERLGLLVLVPLVVLVPVVTGGIDLLAVGFSLALSAVTLPVQLGRDWVALHGARTAVATVPLLVAVVAVDPAHSGWIAAACAIGALLALVSALLVLPHGRHTVGVALLAVVGTAPVLGLATATDRSTAAILAAALSAVVLGLVLLGRRLPGVDEPVRRVWAAWAAAAVLVAVVVAFDGAVAAPVLLALGCATAVVGASSNVARGASMTFAALGMVYYVDLAPVSALLHPTVPSPAHAVSILVSSVLAAAYVALTVRVRWAQRDADEDVTRLAVAVAGCGLLYAVTTSAVTAGVLIGGRDGGFYAGHVAATVVWLAVAGVALRVAVVLPRARRALPVAAGMTLVAAAVAKVFLFDLATLAGIFRVVVFIVVGLGLLGMGAWYARTLANGTDSGESDAGDAVVDR